MPTSEVSRVDLPAPLRPIRATISPASTAQVDLAQGDRLAVAHHEPTYVDKASRRDDRS